MKVAYEEGVFEELVNIAAYIAEDNEEIAHRFLDACDSTFRFLTENPRIGSPGKFTNAELSAVKMWRVKGL